MERYFNIAEHCIPSERYMLSVPTARHIEKPRDERLFDRDLVLGGKTLHIVER